MWPKGIVWWNGVWPAGDWESVTGGDEKKNLALGFTEESPGDSRPIRQDIGETGGSFGSFGNCTRPRRNHYTVEDRRGLAKKV